MARPSILGNHPPTEAEVNHALECCKAIPHIREELLAMEQEMSDIKESLGKAVSQNEQELYQFMLEEKEKKCQQKWESLEKLIRAIWAIPHANARAAVVGFYLDGTSTRKGGCSASSTRPDLKSLPRRKRCGRTYRSRKHRSRWCSGLKYGLPSWATITAVPCKAAAALCWSLATMWRTAFPAPSR